MTSLGYPLGAALHYSRADLVGGTHTEGFRPLVRTSLLRILTTACLITGVLALEGCGRKGLPEAPSATAAKKAAAAPKDNGSVDPTANSQAKPPRGIMDPALKAGARQEPTPFDFLL